MGAFSWLGQSLDWLKGRWSEDWHDVGSTFTESWKRAPGQMLNVEKGLSGMIGGPFADDGDFWGSARLWIDSVVGTGSSVLGGTLGTVFQIPILHEAAWLLEKAYRYGVARPLTTQFLMASNNVRDAYNQGRFTSTDLASGLFSWQAYRKAWNDSAYVTPGQAIVYDTTMSARFLDDFDAAMDWGNRNDPRTPEGQAKFNSPDASFWLKYTSGSLDLAASFAADPGHGSALAYKAGRLGFFDKVATPRYVAAGKVHEELGSSAVNKVRQTAENTDSPEEFGQLVMPGARFRGPAQDMLWRAAQIDKRIRKSSGQNSNLFDDTYLTLRAFDFDAFQRVVDKVPKIALEFSDLFTTHVLSDYDFQRGQLANGVPGANALRGTVLDAFIDSFAGQEGQLWTSALGKLANDKMPRARQLSAIRAGYHSYVLNNRPIIIGRPLANVMPSQGWTPRIDANDGTGIGLRQFRANLERSAHLTPKEVNDWVSQYGAATDDAMRHTVAMRVEDQIVKRAFGRFGLDDMALNDVLSELNRWRSGQRKIWGYERRYISEEAAKRAEKATASYDTDRALELYRQTEEFKKAVEEGRTTDGYVTMQDVDGRMNMIPVNRALPVLRSQFADVITMLDYRALNGALRWYRLTHPKLRTLPEPESTLSGLYRDKAKRPMDERDMFEEDMVAAPEGSKPGEWYTTVDPETGVESRSYGRENFSPKGWTARRIEVKETEYVPAPGTEQVSHVVGPAPEDVKVLKAREDARVAAEREQLRREIDRENNWKLGIAKLAKLHGFYDATIGALDAMSVLWKATALMRPAQAPRNVADDVLRTHIAFGKLPLLLAASDILPNAWRNWVSSKAEGRRGRASLIWEAMQDSLVKYNAKGERPSIAGVVEGPVVDNLDAAKAYMTPAAAFADGVISLDGYITLLRAQFDAILGFGPKFGTKRFETKVEPPPLFRPSGTMTRIEQETGRVPVGQLAPKQKPPREKPPRPSEEPGITDTPYWPAYAGPPHYIEATLFRMFEAGHIREETFRSKLALAALSMAGRTKFMNQRWGTNLIKRVVTQHMRRSMAEGYWQDPYGPGTVVVNPFDGSYPKEVNKDLRKHYDIEAEHELLTRDIAKKRPGSVQSVSLEWPAEQMVEWVSGNLDELMKPETLLALRMKPNGHIAIGFARVKSELADKVTIKKGARQRLRNFHIDEIKDIAHTGFDVKLPNGQSISFGGVLDGPMGQQMQHRISARSNPQQAWGSLVSSDVEMLASLREQGSWATPLPPQHKDYAINWERAVNAQIASDPVARQFLKGKTDSQVINLVETTDWGRDWRRAMGFRAVAYVDQIRQIEAMVDTYLPTKNIDNEVMSERAAQALREAALEKRATRQMLDQVLERNNQPEVHGVSVDDVLGNSRLWQSSRKLMRFTQKWISDMPVDKIGRFPFMAMAYKQHGTALAKIAGQYFKDGPVPADVVNLVKETAREASYHDTRYRLYDTSQRNDFANATRLLMPFSAAMMDSYIKYGRSIRENPMLLVQGAYYWTMFERNGMIQDENGNVAHEEDGHTAWYRVDPTTGQRSRVPDDKVGQHKYIQFQLPSALASWAGKKYYGVDAKPVVAINKDTMNVFLNLPSAGPLVALPANEFAMSNPEFGEDHTVRTYILPFGPSANRGRVVLPSTVRTAWDAFVAEDGNTAEGHAAAIMQAELTGYALGTRNTPPTFEEVREKASAMRGLRFLATFVSPASFQLQSPYQPYVDAYRQLVQANPQTAAEEFQRRHGDEFYAVQMSVTRNTAGLTASLKSYEAYQKYRKLIEQYPEFGGLIVGSEGGGAFAKSVYESQKDTPLRPGSTDTLRTLMSLEESTQELQKKTVWAKYVQMNNLIRAAMVDRGITSLRSRAAKDLKATKDAFVKAHMTWIDPATGKETLSPWYLDFQTSDRGSVERKFEALWTIVQDPQLQKREDIRGLAQYLNMRKQMQQIMDSRRFGSLASQQARGLSLRWDAQVNDLVESNGAFHDLWARWLSNDDKLDLG